MFALDKAGLAYFWASVKGKFAPPASNLSGQPVPAFGQPAQNGSSTNPARSDHAHALPVIPNAGNAVTGGLRVRFDSVTSSLYITNNGTNP